MFQRKPDRGMLIMLAALLAFGLVMLKSASGPMGFERFGDQYWFVKHQITNGLLPGLVLFCVGFTIDYRHWQTWGPRFLWLSAGLLTLVFIPGLAADWGTSRSWIRVFGMSVQPIEFVKFLYLVWLAAFFANRDDTAMGSAAETLKPFTASLAVIAVLLMLQPDLGSLLVVASIAVATYFVAGARWRHIGALALAGAAGVFALAKVAPYRAARLTTFMHPELDPQGMGYHINQAFLAIGSGGWFGLGLGQSQQKYLALPEAAGDSIFAVMAEELGLVLMLALVALLCLFILRLIRVSHRAPDRFGRLLAAGVAAWVFSQALFNAGSMVGIMPITGLPLPFISYGGTSLAVLLGVMGVMANISSHASTEAVPRR